jgi:hypothetical protein
MCYNMLVGLLHEEDNNNILGTVYISYTLILHIVTGTVMAVNVCWLDLCLPMQSVPVSDITYG